MSGTGRSDPFHRPDLLSQIWDLTYISVGCEKPPLHHVLSVLCSSAPCSLPSRPLKSIRRGFGFGAGWGETPEKRRILECARAPKPASCSCGQLRP